MKIDNPVLASLEALGRPALAADREGRVVEANGALTALLGRDRGDLIGRPLGEAMGCVHGQAPGACGETSHCALCTVRRTFVAVRDGAGPLGGIAATLETRDGVAELSVSARKQGSVVQLAVDSVRAGAAKPDEHHRFELAGRLASTIAHDLVNVLTAVISTTAQARLESEPGPVRALLDEAHDDAARAGRLARQLLSLGRELFEPRPVLLGELVQALEPLLRRLLPQRSKLVLEQGEVARLQGDANLLEQVILNLVLNARDAMPYGGTVRVRSGRQRVESSGHPQRVPGDYAVLTVEDDGVGIPAHLRPSIFDPYVTTKGARGTGLGLATVASAARRHGGWAELDSVEGRGTTVRVFLPLTSAEAPAASRGTG